MTTIVKAEVNRNNSKHSTGPKTTNGKAVAKLNAVSHGLRSLSPVLQDERPKDWNDHRKGIVAALVPIGTLEAELAERVALLTWRLRRVVRYETAITTSGIDWAVAHVRGAKEGEDEFDDTLSSFSGSERTYAEVKKELDAAREHEWAVGLQDQLRKLPDLSADHQIDGDDAFQMLLQLTGYTPNAELDPVDVEDHAFLADVGVPEEWRDDPDWWDGWTAEMVRAGVKVIATVGKMTDTELLDRAVREIDQTASLERRKSLKLEAELARLSNGITEAVQVARGRTLLPSAEVVDKVMRYESHLNKQLVQTLHQLERLQAIRVGNPPVPPAALDLTVEAGGLVIKPGG